MNRKVERVYLTLVILGILVAIVALVLTIIGMINDLSK